MNRNLPIWLTIAIALIAFAAGLFIDRHYLSSADGNIIDVRNNGKVKAILDLIAQEYVDTVNPDALMEKSIPFILKGLDPHTSYFDPQNSKITRDHPDGVIPDIGAVLIVINDSIHVECIVPAGPSDIAGILPGDCIVKIDGQPTANMQGHVERATP